MGMKINPLGKPFDMVGQTTADIAANDLLYLKLDQTTPQTVINDAPHFDKGIVIKSGEKLIFDGA
jgi:hypothetical protein